MKTSRAMFGGDLCLCLAGKDVLGKVRLGSLDQSPNRHRPQARCQRALAVGATHALHDHSFGNLVHVPVLYGQAGWRRSFFVRQQQVFVVEDVRRDLVQASSGGGDVQYAAAPWIQLPQIGVRQQVLRHLLEASALGGKVQQVPACRRTFVPQVLLRQEPGGDLFEEAVQATGK